MTNRFWQVLDSWARTTAGIELSDRQRVQLHKYLETLMFWNRRMALVAASGGAEIVLKHIADSLFAAGRCKNGEAVVDLGSGAGLPGLPLAIVRPQSRVCLVESRGKKASFLSEAVRGSEVRNALVFHGRIEQAAADPEHAGRYGVVIARALGGTSELLEMARPFLREGGRVIAMKSVGEQPPARVTCETVDYVLPERTPRRLLILRP